MKIYRRCPFTGDTVMMDLPVTVGQVRQWKSGTLIQHAMPHLTDQEREFLISGITPLIWQEFMELMDQADQNRCPACGEFEECRCDGMDYEAAS